MAKNINVYKFQIMERAIREVDFTTKEEVVEFINKMRDVAVENPDYSKEIKNAFRVGAKEIAEELSLKELLEIKKILNNQN